MRAFLAKLKAGTVELNFGREIVAAMAARHASALPPGEAAVLDVGLGTAVDLLNVREALAPRPSRLVGLDTYAPSLEHAEKRGIGAFRTDIERDRFPFDDKSVDIVIANQVLEHTKEIFWVVSEISRVLRPGGVLIAGMPNLASLHSRVMLGLGMQPSPVEVLGPHVRGFTRGGFRRFVEADGYFRVTEARASNFYPLPRLMARPAARVMPSMAVSLFFLCRRTEKEGRFIEVLDTRFFETEYFKGT